MTTSTDAAPGPRAAGVTGISPRWSPTATGPPAPGRRPRAGPSLRDELPGRARDHRRAAARRGARGALGDRQRAVAGELYVNLRESVDVTSQENKDLSAAVRSRARRAANALRFFDLEWIVLDEDRARLYDAPEVARDRHYLVALRRSPAHSPGPRSGCSPSGAQRRSAPGRRSSAASPRRWRVPFDAGDGPERTDRPPAGPRARPRSRAAAASARDALRSGAPHADARAQLRHARRRPPRDGPAAPLLVADGADPPAQRAARRGRRPHARYRRAPLRSPTAGSA